MVVASHSDSSITLSWDAQVAPANGNIDILAYNIFWDNGSGGNPSSELANTTNNNFTTQNLVTGKTYRFVVRSRNLYGYGPFSAVAVSLAISVP